MTSACLNVRYAVSGDGGKTWSSSIPVTSVLTNLNYEQFGGRLVPVLRRLHHGRRAGQYERVRLDQRDTVSAPDPSGDDDAAVVAGDPETGGACTSAFTTCFDSTHGLDQNIYSAAIAP
jgi:hypothetical protein